MGIISPPESVIDARQILRDKTKLKGELMLVLLGQGSMACQIVARHERIAPMGGEH